MNYVTYVLFIRNTYTYTNISDYYLKALTVPISIYPKRLKKW